jgi:hypothetical protein
MAEPTTACRTDRHHVCGGHRCACRCHAELSPGQAAYETWVSVVRGYKPTPEWHRITMRERDAWEAAAKASSSHG